MPKNFDSFPLLIYAGKTISWRDNCDWRVFLRKNEFHGRQRTGNVRISLFKHIYLILYRSRTNRKQATFFRSSGKVFVNLSAMNATIRHLFIKFSPRMSTTKRCLYFAQLIFLLNSVENVPIGSIANVFLFGGAPTQIIPNVTCNQCICNMVLSSFASINCFSANQSCQVFANYSPLPIYALLPTSNAVFYFRILPQIVTTNTACKFFDIFGFGKSFLFSIVTTFSPTTTQESLSTIRKCRILNHENPPFSKSYWVFHRRVIDDSSYSKYSIAKSLQ